MVHHATQVRMIEVELQAELWQMKEEIKVARKQQDEAMAGKQVQLERKCDQVYEIEMMLQMELQKARRELQIETMRCRNWTCRRITSRSKWHRLSGSFRGSSSALWPRSNSFANSVTALS